MLLRCLPIAVCVLGCARIFSVRVGAGVERSTDDETHVLGSLTLGFAAHAKAGHYIVPNGRATTTNREGSDAILGAGIEWLLATSAVGFRLGPEYRTEKTLDGDTLSHGIGARAAALVVIWREERPAEDGLLEALGEAFAHKASTNIGSACFGICPSEHGASGRVEHRHSFGIEAAGHTVFGTDRGRVGYVGLTFEYDVLRARGVRGPSVPSDGSSSAKR